jgi:hypothetical protein
MAVAMASGLRKIMSLAVRLGFAASVATPENGLQVNQWALRDSNPRPAGCKPAALTN